ncbi:hypothetical protein FIBSPDRAFT_979064 [Athelia psychrophila]|uniref:Uncharacterized protein n=1 Tax=Athelia psychrophila TaxID=1759441 RepID=A0A166DRQ4_9AGAM|nr:hypothetical protein FIBSPDRAFT_979064 [Fibularhizoctonia sp. CBS 109695]
MHMIIRTWASVDCLSILLGAEIVHAIAFNVSTTAQQPTQLDRVDYLRLHTGWDTAVDWISRDRRWGSGFTSVSEVKLRSCDGILCSGDLAGSGSCHPKEAKVPR